MSARISSDHPCSLQSSAVEEGIPLLEGQFLKMTIVLL